MARRTKWSAAHLRQELLLWLENRNPEFDPTESFRLMGCDGWPLADEAIQHWKRTGDLVDAHFERLYQWLDTRVRTERSNRLAQAQPVQPTQKSQDKKRQQQRLNAALGNSKPIGEALSPNKQEKKRFAESVLARITESGLHYRQLNEYPLHCRIERHGEKFDIWPATGRWHLIGSQTTGQGVESLLRAVGR